MIKLLTFAVIGAYLYFSLKKYFSKKSPKPEFSHSGEFTEDELVEDPFCHTFVAEHNAVSKIFHGKKEFFCSQECASKYQLIQESN
ncbi:MAG: hypothetical protein HQM13_20890 [SAR324 cluster bacterium]|nr:hypothetical protein [SAR324 cluster bacterium]